MKIERLQSEHIAALRQIYLDARTTTFTWQDTTYFALSDFDTDTEGEQIWVALEDREVLGFISVWEPDSFIHHLFVSPQKLHCGIGSKLLNIAKQQYSELSLKCFVANENAIHFYHSQGFRITSTSESGFESYHLMTFSIKSKDVPTHKAI